MTDIKSMKSKLMKNWGWVVTFASFIMNFFGFGIMYCFSITFVSLQEEFSSASSATSWVGSIPIGLATSSGVIVTPLVGRFENRPVAITGVFLCCISCLLTSFITDFNLLYFTYSALYGLGIGFCSLASMDLLLRYFPRKNCSRATLISLVGSSSGMLVLGPVTYIIIENWGWRNMFRVFGTLLLVVALPATMTFSRPNTNRHACAEDGEITEDKGSYENERFVAEGLNGQEIISNHKNHPSVKVGSSNMLTKESMDNTWTKGNFEDACPSDGRRPVDDPDNMDKETVPTRWDSVTMISSDLVFHAKCDPEDVALDDPKETSVDSVDIDNVVSFKTITISSSVIYNVEQTEVEGHVTSPDVAQTKHLGTEEGRDHSGFFQRYRALFYPDLWFICVCIAGLPMMNTFYYINVGDFLISRGFERHVIPWVVTTFGVSEVAGKILLAVVADRLPFPKIFIYHFACAVGIMVMGGLLVVRSVPVLLCLAIAIGMIVMMVADALAYSICNQVFRPGDVVQTWTVVMVTQGSGYMLGSLFGESIDRTGSYDIAIYTSMGVYALCGLFCAAVPLYQKLFVPERFVMFEYQAACRRKRSMKKRYKPNETIKVPK